MALSLSVCHCVGAKSIGAGHQHSLVVTRANTVEAWGWNWSGQVAPGAAREQRSPFAVTLPAGNIAWVGGGYSTSFAVTNEGAVYVWGRSQAPTLVTLPKPAMAVVAGGDHMLALLSGGEVWAFGSNVDGALGTGGAGVLGDLLPPAKVELEAPAVGIAAGQRHSLALLNDGRVFAWGGNANGQLGNGTRERSLVPIFVRDGIKSIASCGACDFSLAIAGAIDDLGDAPVFGWGTNQYGQLGPRSQGQDILTPQVIDEVNARWVAAGSAHTLALKNDGTMLSWGANWEGQLGDGTRQARSRPRLISMSVGLAEVAAGHAHSLARSRDGAIYAWGQNAFGQLGTGTSTASLVPVKVR
ncbi:hypothetical protein L6R52_07120 [Myxococcota bacterium]|nr:hypothetical protein [Myxococcota bacterium]